MSITPRYTEYSLISRIAICGQDILIMYASMILTMLTWFHLPAQYSLALSDWGILLLATLAYVPATLVFPPLCAQRFIRGDQILENVWSYTLLHLVILAGICGMVYDDKLPYILFIGFFAYHLIISTAARLLWHAVTKWMRKNGQNAKNVVLIGSEDITQTLSKTLSNKNYGINILHVFNSLGTSTYPEQPALDFIQEKESIDDIYCTTSTHSRKSIEQLRHLCKNKNIRLHFVPQIEGQILRNVQLNHAGTFALLNEEEAILLHSSSRTLKRISDFIGALLLCLTLYPIVYMIAAIGIKAQSRGPILQRVLKYRPDGKAYNELEFRCEHLPYDDEYDDEEDEWDYSFAMGNFLKRTGLYRWPQLLNVLRGDMSFVGPSSLSSDTPESSLSEISSHECIIHLKPGLISLPQIKNENKEQDDTFCSKAYIECALWYAENWSVWLDIYTLLSKDDYPTQYLPMEEPKQEEENSSNNNIYTLL